MTTALATISDVAASLGRSVASLSVEETARATSLILSASAEVEIETGYKFAPNISPAYYTIGRKPRSGRVKIPATVAVITAVREIDRVDGKVTVLTLTTDYTVYDGTIYGLGSRCFVEIDFTVTAAIPDEIVKLVAGIVTRTLAGPPTGVESETAGPFSKSYVNNNGDVYLSKMDKLILRPYKQTKSALSMI